MVSFYWFTRTFPRSLYHATLVKDLLAGHPHPISMEKPLGYSLFPYDLVVLPKAWAKEIYPNLAFFRSHSKVSDICTSDNLLYVKSLNRTFRGVILPA